MKYSIQHDEIVLSQVGDYYNALADSGAFRWNRRDKTMRAPLTRENLGALQLAAGRLPEHLGQIFETLCRRERMLQSQREQLDKDPKPLVHYPVKANLMRHQIAGANSALIIFGLIDREET